MPPGTCPAKRDLSKLEKQKHKNTPVTDEDELSLPRFFHCSLPDQPLTCAGRKEDAGGLDRLQPELPHKMTHLTLTGRDRPQAHIFPHQFHERKAKVKSEAQTHPVLFRPTCFL